MPKIGESWVGDSARIDKGRTAPLAASGCASAGRIGAAWATLVAAVGLCAMGDGVGTGRGLMSAALAVCFASAGFVTTGAKACATLGATSTLIGLLAAGGVLRMGESWANAAVLRKAGGAAGAVAAAAANCPFIAAGAGVGVASADRSARIGRGMAGAEGDRAAGVRAARSVANEASTETGGAPGLGGSVAGAVTVRVVVIARAGAGVVATLDGTAGGTGCIWCGLSGVGAEVATATGCAVLSLPRFVAAVSEL